MIATPLKTPNLKTPHPRTGRPKTLRLKTRCFIASVAVAAVATPAAAQQLVSNGGFEAGSFAGWVQTGNSGFSDVSDGIQHSGSFAALFGPIGAPGGIAQMLTTVSGRRYDVSFWLQSSGDAPNSFAWSVNGAAQTPSLTDAGAFGYTRFAGNFLATGTATQLAFSFRSDPGFWYLDDVSVAVAAVPEAGEWAMMLAGLGIVATARRSRLGSRQRTGTPGITHNIS